MPAVGQQPVGVGPLPINFDITDQNGAWFDSGLNLFGSKSVAVGVLPRVAPAGGVPSVGGPLLPADGSLVENITGGLTGGLGGAGASADPLGLNSTLATVQGLAKSSPEAAGKAAEAEDLIGQLKATVADMPAGEPVDLDSLPVGVDLMGVLDSLKDFTVEGPPVTVTFNVDPAKSQAIRNPIGLIAPEGADGFPWMDSKGAFYGKKTIQLTEPGLYAFTDSIAVYGLGAVVVDDPLTLGLDFGENLVVNGKPEPVPSNADIIQRLVNTAFTASNPNNWQQQSATKEVSWNPVQPPVPILQHDADGKPVLIPNLDAYFDQKFGYPKKLPALKKPTAPGVGEVWFATQMEDYAGKEKHGSITKIDAEDWTIDRKIAAPEINMNNVHNMWTDKTYKYLYGNEWFDNETDVFDRETGKFIRSLEVGPNPAHVMTRPGNDNLTIGINAGTDIVEAAPGATKIIKRIHVDPDSGMTPHPHAHWTSHDGKTVVAPDTMANEAAIVDLDSGKVRHEPVGAFPIATSMTPDSKKAYLSNFLGMSVSCVSLKEDACATPDGGVAKNSTIDLWENYDPQTGPEAGKPWGGLTVQLPVSPDGKALLAVNTLSATVDVIDPKTNKMITQLPCNPGCHGANFGAKKGGGYYAYVSNKFSNAMQIIDVDPNNDGDISDAAIAGQLPLGPTSDTKMDDELVAHPGVGGQGVLALPLVYNGWSQEIPKAWRKGLTCEQINPIDESAC
ncbi:YncE family protein [Nocardioides sp. NPDC051685]|uniref:YncE family protein n=1 Tax=Nocardioides sp. NPDC051685 TaxID=3364334 RepID=UPI0037A3C8D5